MYRIGIIIEQALGHITHTKNLQAAIPNDPSVTAHWVLPDWKRDGLAGKVPVLKNNWTLQASLQARRQIGLLMRETPLDALFFHTQVTATLAQNWVRRVPSIVSLDATPLQYDSLGPYYAHDPGPGWLEQKKWTLNRNCFRDARHLVTWSAWAKEGLVTEYEVDPQKVTVIPPGVPIADWRRPTPRVAGTGPVRALFVGGDLDRKGGHVLLEAFRALRAQLGTEQFELHLVTKSRVDEAPGLFVHNNMQANSAPLKQLFFDSDFFVLPTLGDCLPMALAEAGAAGLPTVSTNVAAIPELVKDGETGFIVPPGDEEALFRAMRSLIEDPALRRAQGAAAARHVAAEHDAVANAGRLLTLLKNVAAAPRSVPV